MFGLCGGHHVSAAVNMTGPLISDERMVASRRGRFRTFFLNLGPTGVETFRTLDRL